MAVAMVVVVMMAVVVVMAVVMMMVAVVMAVSLAGHQGLALAATAIAHGRILRGVPAGGPVSQF